MSMYSMVFGTDDRGPMILSCLGLEPDDFGRYRDVWLKDGRICVYTRNGGGNRNSYQDVFQRMSKHLDFESASDDDFDCTYCTFYFRYPEPYHELLTALEDPKTLDGDTRWFTFLASLKKNR